MSEATANISNSAVVNTSILLKALTTEEREVIARASTMARVARGETIWMAGEEVDYFGLVASGFVKMVSSSAAGSDITLELIGPGQIFGLLGAIEGTGCRLMAIAVTKVQFLRIPKRIFLPIYQRNPNFKDRLLARTSERLHEKLYLMSKVAGGRVRQRIAAVLLLLAHSYGEQGKDGTRITIPLTRQDLGDMAGTTVESTIRLLSSWQKKGIIHTDNHYITIKNERALRTATD